MNRYYFIAEKANSIVKDFYTCDNATEAFEAFIEKYGSAGYELIMFIKVDIL